MKSICFQERASTRSGTNVHYLLHSCYVTWIHRGETWHIGWGLLILAMILLSLWTLCLLKVKVKYFWFATWLHSWSIMWLCGWSPLILSHHPAKFGVHKPCERRDTIFFICHVTAVSECHVTLQVGSPHPKSSSC